MTWIVVIALLVCGIACLAMDPQRRINTRMSRQVRASRKTEFDSLQEAPATER